MSNEHQWPTFEEWKASLPADDIRKVEALSDRMRAAGAADPEEWVRSEISENFAQAARYAFLRAVWRGLERWRDDAFVDRVLGESDQTDGARDDRRSLLARVAFEATLDVLMVIDNGEDLESTTPMPGWQLMEADDDGALTGRDVGGLHESILEVDPLGIEAEDIRGW
jgi:hypothetical protein